MHAEFPPLFEIDALQRFDGIARLKRVARRIRKTTIRLPVPALASGHG